MDQKINTDTLSEVFEGGIANYECNSGINSREDTNSGLENVKDLHQQRVDVDRKKPEHMLIDSEVTIGGRQDARSARERLLNAIRARFNQVMIKMDVSYMDHPHILGKKEATIGAVMEETGCFIRFPTSNVSCATRKSNQVEIIGNIEGAERARSLVRKLTPLIFSFELPNVLNPDIININTPYVNKLQQEYRVQVTLQTEPEHHRAFVKVHGVEWRTRELKQAVCLLIEFMCGNLSNQIRVQMCMDISTYHHAKVTGKNHANLESIIDNTQTEITFPNTWDSNSPSSKQTNVVISGNIDNVYLARQQLTGSLPLVVMFDLPHEGVIKWNRKKLATIQWELGVSINIHYPEKQNCVIRGVERYAGKIYEARNRVLGINRPRIVTDIPLSYFIPTVGNTPEVIVAMNAQTSSHLLPSPIEKPFNQAVPSVRMVEKPQSLYNNNLHNSLATNGYSAVGELSSNIASLKHRQEESNMPSLIESPKAITSPSYQAMAFKHFIVCDTPPLYFIPTIGITSEVTPSMNVQPSSQLISPLMWQHFNQAVSSEEIVHQSPFLYNSILHNSLATTGYSALGEFLPNTVLLTPTQKEGYPSFSNTSNIPSYLESFSSSYQAMASKGFTVSTGIQEMQNKQEEYRVPTNLESGHGVSFTHFRPSQLCDQNEDQASKNCIYSQSKQKEYQQSLTTLYLDKKRIAGIRDMQNKKEEDYHVLRNRGSCLGVSTSIGALKLSDQEKDQAPKNHIYTRSKRNEHQQSFTTPDIDQKRVADGISYTNLGVLQLSNQEEEQASKDLSTNNILEPTAFSVKNQFTNDLQSTLTSVGLKRYVRLFTFYEIDLTIFLSLDDYDLGELGIAEFCDREKMKSLISGYILISVFTKYNLLFPEMNKPPSPLSAVP